MGAAHWDGLSTPAFDALEREQQAEIVAGYLTANRLESVIMHAARKDGGGDVLDEE